MPAAPVAVLLGAYARVGGSCLQIDNLLVRVTGHNAYFVIPGKEIQDESIARESHAL